GGSSGCRGRSGRGEAVLAEHCPGFPLFRQSANLGMLVAFDFPNMNAKNITLRPGRPTDAAKIAAMSRDLIETGLGWSWGPERVARSIANKDTFTLLACD